MPHLLHPYKLVMGGDIAPVVQSNFALSANDFDSLSSTSTMPTGGSISRAGNAMLYAVDGGVAKLTYAPNNLALYNADFSNGVWSSYYASKVGPYAGTDPAGTNTAYEIGLDGGGGGGSATLVYQTFTAVTGVRYMASFYVRAKTGTTSVRVRFFDGSVNDYSSNITVDSTGWTRVYYAYTSTASSASAFFGINTNSTANTTNVYVAFAQLEAVTYQTSPSGTYYLNYPTPNTTSAYYGPRFDYDPVTLQPKGLLVEGTRTNRCSYSQDIANSSGWAAYGTGTCTPISSPNPSGVNSSYQIDMPAANTGWHTLNVPVTIGTTHTLSLWIKADAAGTIRFFDGNGILVGADATINVTTSWQRFSITGTASITNDCQLGVYRNSAGQLSKVYIWGGQIELGGFATSYIPVPAASTAPTNTRSPDAFTLTGYANRLVEAYYIDEETGGSYSGNSAIVTSGAVTINPPTFGWVTSLRAYTNAYAGSISSPSWLSFSRAGNAMYYDSTGTLTYAPANLAQYSNSFDTVAGWGVGNATAVVVSGSTTTAPDGSATAYKLAEVNIGSPAQHYDVVAFGARATIVTGQTYVCSMYVKAAERSVVEIRGDAGFGNLGALSTFNLSSGTATAGAGVSSVRIVSVGNGWYRCSTVAVATGTSAQIGVYLSDGSTTSYTGTTGNGLYIWGAQVEPVTYATAPSVYIPTISAAVYGPRYDFDPSTVPATPRGLLIEESRANLLAYSNALNNTSVWVSTITSIAASPNISPDGTTNALTLTIPSVANKYVYQGYAISVTGNATASIWARVTSGTGKVYLSLYDGPSTITTTTCNLTPQWQRFTVTRGQTSGNTGYFVVGQTSTSTDASPSVEVFGAQLEAGSFATSYIPTTSASVTRAADVAQLTGSALTTLQGTNFSAGMQFTTAIPSASVNQQLLFAGTQGSTLALLYMNTNTTAGTYDPLSSPNASGTATTGSGGWTTTARAFLSNSAVGRSVVMNNGNVANASALVTARTVIQLGAYTNNAGYNCGWVASFAAYNQRLPDAILKQKSSVGAPY